MQIASLGATPLSDLMTWPVYSGHSDMTLLRVEQLFNTHDINHLPIVDDNMEPIGLVSRSDLARLTNWKAFFQPEQHASKREHLLRTLLADEVMNKPAICLVETANVQEAADLINQRKVHCIIVVTVAKKLIGVVTAHDLLRLAFPSTKSRSRVAPV